MVLPPEASAAARRERPGIALGTQRPAADSASSAQFFEHDVVEIGGDPPARARRPPDPVALQHQRRIGVGEGEELEVVVGLGALVEVVEHLLAWLWGIDAKQGEGGDAAQGDRRDRAEGADTHTSGAQEIGLGAVQLAHVAIGANQLHRLDLSGDVAQLRPGAVGAGGDRAGDRLAVDVAKVLHRQAEPVQLLVEIGEHGARPDFDQARGGVGVDHAVQRGEVDHRPVGQRRLGEGMAGPSHADRSPSARGGHDGGHQLVAVARPDDLRRAASLIPRPVAPGGGHGVTLARLSSSRPAAPWEALRNGRRRQR